MVTDAPAAHTNTQPFYFKCIYALRMVAALWCLHATLGCDASPTAGTTISGVVLNELGGSVSGAHISVAGTDLSAQSDTAGIFSIADAIVPPSANLTVRAPGFAQQTFRVTQAAQVSSSAFLLLRPFDYSRVITLPAGAEPPAQIHVARSSGTATLLIAPDTLVTADGTPVTGDVWVGLAYWDPLESLRSVPGKLITRDPNNADAEIDLVTYGMVDIRIMQNGQELQVAPGKTIPLLFKVPSTLLPNDREHFALPFLYVYNTDTARWDLQGSTQDGALTFEESTKTFTAHLPHLSCWNLDRPSSPWPACITGNLVSACTGKPLPNFDFRLWILGWEDIGSFDTKTDAAGHYCYNIGVSNITDTVPHNYAAIFPAARNDPNNTSVCQSSGPIMPKLCADSANVSGRGCRYQIDFQVPPGQTCFTKTQYLQNGVPPLPTCANLSSQISNAECHRVCPEGIAIKDLRTCNVCPGTVWTQNTSGNGFCYGIGTTPPGYVPYPFTNNCADLGNVAINDGSCPRGTAATQSDGCKNRAASAAGEPCDPAVTCPCCPCNGALICSDGLCVPNANVVSNISP